MASNPIREVRHLIIWPLEVLEPTDVILCTQEDFEIRLRELKIDLAGKYSLSDLPVPKNIIVYQ